MKTIAGILSVTALIFLFTQCGTARKASGAAAPTDAELTIAQKRWSAATAANLNEGYQIFTTKCTKCHGEKKIATRSETQWAHEIEEMAPKAKLTAAETENLRMYIYSVREAKAGK